MFFVEIALVIYSDYLVAYRGNIVLVFNIFLKDLLRHFIHNFDGSA